MGVLQGHPIPRMKPALKGTPHLAEPTHKRTIIVGSVSRSNQITGVPNSHSATGKK